MKNYYRFTTRESEEVNWIYPFVLMWFVGYIGITILSEGDSLIQAIYFICYVLIAISFSVKLEKRQEEMSG